MQPPFESDFESANDFDRETFEIELGRLIDHARAADVVLEGAYDFRAPEFGHGGYTVEITEIAARSNSAEHGREREPSERTRRQ